MPGHSCWRACGRAHHDEVVDERAYDTREDDEDDPERLVLIIVLDRVNEGVHPEDEGGDAYHEHDDGKKDADPHKTLVHRKEGFICKIV